MTDIDSVQYLIRDSLAVEVDESKPIIDVFMFRAQFREDANKELFVRVLRSRCRPGGGVFCDMTFERLAEGPSYVEIGGWLGDQQNALLFMALGEHHGVWKVITPMTLGFERDSEDAKAMAGMGMVMIGEFDPAKLED